ncbi:SLC13 family permease [Dyella silvae]|uniref:SLC13 family permease n=1 Tax=Dyella silvae TaxID=2994424 RepID=UPI002264A8B1|nr:SLC13 family permease [Dyella silvae]
MHTPSWIARLAQERLLLCFALLAAVLAVADPRPLADYQRWLQAPTLAGLLGLLICIQGIRDSGLVQHAAAALLERTHSLRGLGLLLVSMAAVLSMVLTNDVSLFLLVPMTLAIGRISNVPVMRVVVLEALAVNAGSTLSPIGNPQNLLLWQYMHLPFLTFVRTMLPVFGVMFVLLLLLTWVWMPRGRVVLHAEDIDGHPISASQAILSIAALASMVLMMEHNHALLGALLLLVPFVLLERSILARVDWLLLATFAAIFLALGHFAELGVVQRALDGLDLENPLTLYITGIATSQVISNVPATVLLLRHAPDAMMLAVAVNVGGFGLAIGSLANLIALRLAGQPRGARLLHLVSIPFLLVCAPLVYLVWRWLG